MTGRSRSNITVTLDNTLIKKLRDDHQRRQKEKGDERYKFSHYIEDILKGKINPP